MNRTLCAAAIVLAFFGIGAVRAPAFTLQGVVADRELRVPIGDATVTLVLAARSATTDGNGLFTFGAFEISGSEQIVISHPDYRTVRLPVGSLPQGEWTLGITLVREASGLPGGQADSGTSR